MDKIKETDENLEQKENEEIIEKKEVEIGSYKSHIESIKKGMYEYKIWPNINVALIAMAHPNEYHRIDLRDKEILKRLEKDLNLEIDYDKIQNEINSKPYLIQPNGTKSILDNKNIEKPITKKSVKLNAKKEKIQSKIDVLQKKYDGIKKKKGPRAEKLKLKIEELQIKKDRILL